MGLLRVVCYAVLVLLEVGVALAGGPAPLQAGSGVPPLLFNLRHVPAWKPARATPPLVSALPALPIPRAAPVGGVAYLAVGATVVSPAARLPLAGSGFMPGATVVITDTATTALMIPVEAAMRRTT